MGPPVPGALSLQASHEWKSSSLGRKLKTCVAPGVLRVQRRRVGGGATKEPVSKDFLASHGTSSYSINLLIDGVTAPSAAVFSLSSKSSLSAIGWRNSSFQRTFYFRFIQLYDVMKRPLILRHLQSLFLGSRITTI
jgi:hypothetical protein